MSGPVRRPAAVPRPARRAADLPTNGFAWLRTLPDHRLLDRLIGGRIWIVLLGTLLVGIVTMQLTLLRWNAGIGRAIERSSQLEQRNAALRLSISELSDSERIVSMATQMGFVTPLQGSPRFVTARAGDSAKALTTMRVPDPNLAAAAAAELAATVELAATDSNLTTATDPAAATTDPSATTTDPATTTVDQATTAPTDTTAPTAAVPTGTTPPTTAAPATAAGGASAPVQGQG